MKIIGMQGQLLQWWDRLLDRPSWYRDSGPPEAGPAVKSAAGTARRVPAGAAPGERSPSDAPRGKVPAVRGRSLGMDPYSLDAGFPTGQGWDRVDRS